MAAKTEKVLLMERATLMGIPFHPSIGVKNLKAKIAEYTSDAPAPVKAVEVIVPEIPVETQAQKNTRKRKEASKLHRVNIVCMDPNEKGKEGDWCSMSNRFIGVIKRYIPWNTENGTHVEDVLLNILKEKEYRKTIKKKVNGKVIKRSISVKKFSIDVLPALTSDELTELARVQSINKSTEDE